MGVSPFFCADGCPDGPDAVEGDAVWSAASSGAGF